MRSPQRRALRISAARTGKGENMARTPVDHRFITGTPGDALAHRLADLYAEGWLLAHMSGDARNVVLLLQRERELGDAAAIHAAVEELPEANALMNDIPAEEQLSP